MKFKMIIKRNSMDGADAIGYAVQIPALRMHIDLTANDIQEIKSKKRFEPFLQKLALGILKKKDEKEEDLPSDRMMDSVLQEVYREKNLANQDYDLSFEIDVEYQSPRQCRCCSRILPPLLKVMLPIEIAAGTVLAIASLEWTEETNRAIVISQVAASSIYILCTIFIGPGMAFMKDFGTTIDTTLQSAWRKITCRKKASEEKELQLLTPTTRFPTSLKCALGAVTILGLNNMWVGMSQDYQQFLLMSEKAKQDTPFSPLVFTICVWVSFVLNQPNDVLQTLSSLMFLTAVLTRLFESRTPTIIENNSSTTDWLERKNNDSKDSHTIDILTGTEHKKINKAAFPTDAIAYTPPLSQVGLLGSNNASFPKSRDEPHALTQRLLGNT